MDYYAVCEILFLRRRVVLRLNYFRSDPTSRMCVTAMYLVSLMASARRSCTNMYKLQQVESCIVRRDLFLYVAALRLESCQTGKRHC